MSFDHIFQVILFVVGIGFSADWIIPKAYQVWFHPDEFEKNFKEQAAPHWLSVYDPKSNLKAIIGMYRIFTLVFALVLLVMAIEIILG